MILKPPGPTLRRSSVVGTWKHGHPGSASSGCVLMIANGAAYSASPRFEARADAVVLIVTGPTPRTFANTLGSVRFTFTVTVSFDREAVENETSAAVSVWPFRFA